MKLLSLLVTVVCVACHPTTPPQRADDSPRAAAEECVVKRAAYDIGSATTKVKVAEIDHCNNQVLRVLYADDAPVFYRDDVNRRVPELTSTTMDKGLEVLRSFKAKAATFEPSESAAVATSAFRRARNARVMVKRIGEELGVDVHVVSQLQEARIGFVGAVTTSNVDPKRAVVWDVGGRSMQITTLNEHGRLTIFEGRLASGQMRDYLIRRVKKQSSKVETPNPLTSNEAGDAQEYAHKYAESKVPRALRRKLADRETVVVGIGALKYYGDKPASEHGASCTFHNLRSKMDAMLGKSDEEIGGAYASTAVSDRILIMGFMRALGIETVHLADIDLTDGLLFEAEYWHAAASR